LDVGKNLFNIRSQPRPANHKNIYFSIVPTSTQGAGPSGISITATTAAFNIGRQGTNLSTITFAPYIATQGRIGFSLRSNLWLPNNSWDILGDTRLLYYPQDTWGLGGHPGKGERLTVNYKYIRFYQTFLKRIKPCLYAGMGLLIDDHFDMDTRGDSTLLYSFTRYPHGTGASETSFSKGLSFNLLYDARKNTENPFPGYYANFVYRVNPLFPGSNTTWSSVYLDARKYIPFSHKKQNMLALWTYFWSVFDSHAPYYDLPSIGWDPYQQRSGRGFPQNRYRGNSLLYGEAEYRRDITRNGLLGFVLFANANSVTEPDTDRFTYIHAAAGAGLRIKFNKRSGTNIAIDYARSQYYGGFSINLGETF
ncbi:MAG: BamA/TamA family outer membrane protein, partial [Bacteroidetes bacterium]|nr:BamA/TamA family outer membrane protein [Bacteroidota bacterium]